MKGIKEALEQLEKCKFVDEVGHPIENNTAFIYLKKLVKATNIHLELKKKREELAIILEIRDLGNAVFTMKTGANAIPVCCVTSTGFDNDANDLLLTTLIDYYKEQIADLEYDFKGLEE